MYLYTEWSVKLGDYQLALMESLEINKSVELLADTATISLPGYIHNKVLRYKTSRFENIVKRGLPVEVSIGYKGKDSRPFIFSGYVLNVSTDSEGFKINCEDALFLFRKKIADKVFKKVDIKAIANYIIAQLGLHVTLNCTYTLNYDKFVISKAEGYDVLRKLQDDTKANIYMRMVDGQWQLNIHPPYIEEHGTAYYSFQQNIIDESLKYKNAEDRKIEVVVKSTSPNGRVQEAKFGTTGGEQKEINVSGIAPGSLKQVAESEYNKWHYDGYDGDITAWLMPYVEPGYSCHVRDEDYNYKNGIYYAVSTVVTLDSGGEAVKVTLGKKLADELIGRVTIGAIETE